MPRCGAVAAREESAEENPLAAACSRGNGGRRPWRASSAPRPGAYGAGVEDLLGRRCAIARRARRAPISPPPRTPMAAPMARAAPAPGAFAERVSRRRPAGAFRRRSRPRHARRLGRCRLHRRLRRGGGRARPQRPISSCSTPPIPQRPRRASARRGAGADRARPRGQSALHRGPDAAWPARRGRIRRDGRPAGRLRARRRTPCRAR